MKGNLSVVVVGAKRDDRIVESMATMLTETLNNQYCDAERYHIVGRFIAGTRAVGGKIHVLPKTQVGFAEIVNWEPDVIVYLNPGSVESMPFLSLSQTEQLQRKDFLTRANLDKAVFKIGHGIDVMIADKTTSSIYQSEQGDVQQFVHSFINRYRGVLITL